MGREPSPGRLVKFAVLFALVGFASVAPAQPTSSAEPSLSITAPSTATATVSSSVRPQETGPGACHLHNLELWCTQAGGNEVQVQYTDCHEQGGVTYCTTADGVEVTVTEEQSATVGNTTEVDTTTECAVSKTPYNKKLRVGALFIVLCTSSIAAFGPILLWKFTELKFTGLVFTIIKQFGTGVIIATAYIHLLTEAQLTFSNPCMGELQYEATATAIAMAGIFLSFFIEYLGSRLVQSRASRRQETASEGDLAAEKGQAVPAHGHLHGADPSGGDDHVGVLVMEAGIIFHSVLIGTTLVVSGNTIFNTLLVVIIFHQMFEGLALGTRISQLGRCSLRTKFLMAAAFAAMTPLGMGIGVGVLNAFNENDRRTLIAMGTLDALSAGILAWVGLVEMLAADWMHGDMKASGPLRTAVALLSLMAGMAMMALLGKWA